MLGDDPVVLALALSRCEALSLDVFDTALLRAVELPTDVFTLVARQYAHQHPRAVGFDFAAARIEAEQAARRRTSRGDVTLDEIYACLVPPTGWDREALRRLELELERAVLRPNPAILSLYHAARALGRRVAFVSDMYLPASFIEEALARAGYTERAAVLVSSTEGGESKGAGTLYARLASRLGLPPSRILHVGDHELADVERALARGLAAAHYRSCRSFEPSAREAQGPARSIHRGLVLAHRYAERGRAAGREPWELIGYEAIGPSFHRLRGDEAAIAHALEAEGLGPLARLFPRRGDARAEALRAGARGLADELARLSEIMPWLSFAEAELGEPLSRLVRRPRTDEGAALRSLTPRVDAGTDAMAPKGSTVPSLVETAASFIASLHASDLTLLGPAPGPLAAALGARALRLVPKSAELVVIVTAGVRPDALAALVEESREARRVLLVLDEEPGQDPPPLRWVEAYASHGLHRDFDRLAPAPQLISLTRGLPSSDWVAAYEDRVQSLEREIAARRLVGAEYLAMLGEREHRIETLERVVTHIGEDAHAIVEGIMVLRNRLAPADSLRTRAFDWSLSRLREGERVLLQALDLRDRVLAQGRALLRRRG